MKINSYKYNHYKNNYICTRKFQHMTKQISVELNSLNFIKHAFFKDYQIPEKFNYLNLTQERILLQVSSSVNHSMVSIARAIGLEKGPFSQTVDKLEKLDLVRRVRSEEDKRQVNLQLTAQGQQVADELQQGMEAHFQKLVEHFSTAEIEAFYNALEVLKRTANNILNK